MIGGEQSRDPSNRLPLVQVTTDTSFQVIVEGIWGTPRASGYIAVDDVTFYDGECSPLPRTAAVVRGACSFDRDSCGWRNTSTAETFDWRMATLTKVSCDWRRAGYVSSMLISDWSSGPRTCRTRRTALRWVTPTLTSSTLAAGRLTTWPCIVDSIGRGSSHNIEVGPWFSKSVPCTQHSWTKKSSIKVQEDA